MSYHDKTRTIRANRVSAAAAASTHTHTCCIFKCILLFSISHICIRVCIYYNICAFGVCINNSHEDPPCRPWTLATTTDQNSIYNTNVGVRCENFITVEIIAHY